jgi:hypothetical protein
MVILTESKKTGFYTVPGFARYAVSKDGELYDLQKQTLVSGYVRTRKYLWDSLYSDCGKRTRISRHHVVAITFIGPKPIFVNARAVVNHIDGDQTNNASYNLEWTTDKENIEHAGRLGLTTKCMPIVVKDVVTGVEEEFPSATEYARQRGFSKDAILYRLREDPSRVWPEKKQYRALLKPVVWNTPNNIEAALAKNTTSKKVLIREFRTGKVLCFDQIKQAADYLSVTSSSITMWLNKKDQPVLTGCIQIKLLSDETPWREVTDPEKELLESQLARPVVMLHEESGEKFYYSSITECANAIGRGKTTVAYRLKSNGQWTFSDGYRYKYANE